MSNIVSLYFFLGIAVWQDVRIRKISNLLILAGLFTGFLYRLQAGGWNELAVSFLGQIPVLIVLYPLFLCRCLGAGDIKLLLVVAVYLSWQKSLAVFALSLYLSLILIVIKLFYDRMIRHSKLYLLGMQLPMSGPILGAVFILQYKEVLF